MDNIYSKIYNMAMPYLDTRKNDIHISLSLMFAYRLLEHYPEADRNIVLPAVILHDVGWKSVPEEKQCGAFGPNAKDPETQRLHEIEGARIAEEILHTLDYDEAMIAEIIKIIDGHDSRGEMISLNDALVKDSDKLWRFTREGVKIDHMRFGIELDIYIEYLGNVIDRWFFTPAARQMAFETWNETRSIKI